jgi:hypothetical protein
MTTDFVFFFSIIMAEARCIELRYMATNLLVRECRIRDVIHCEISDFHSFEDGDVVVGCEAV